MVPAKSTGLLIVLGTVLLFISLNGAEVIPHKVLSKADIKQTRAVRQSFSFWRKNLKRMCYGIVFKKMEGQNSTVTQSCDNGKCAGVDYHTILKMYPGKTYILFKIKHKHKRKTTPVTTGWMGKRDLSANNAQFVSVDLIGEKNQVILEYTINAKHKTRKPCMCAILRLIMFVSLK